MPQRRAYHISLLNRLLKARHRARSEQHPLQRLDADWCVLLLRKDGPHRDRQTFVPGGCEQTDGGIAYVHMCRARRATALTGYLQDLDTFYQSKLHRLPQMSLIVP